MTNEIRWFLRLLVSCERWFACIYHYVIRACFYTARSLGFISHLVWYLGLVPLLILRVFLPQSFLNHPPWVSSESEPLLWIDARSAELAVLIILYPTVKKNKSASGIIVLLKTPTKYRQFFPTFFVKTSDFQLVFNFEQTEQLPYLEKIVRWLIYW